MHGAVSGRATPGGAPAAVVGAAADRAGARIRPRRVRLLRRTLTAFAAVLCGLLLVARPGSDPALLGVLVAGGWSLGLLPIHADPGSTGPGRRSGESTDTADRPASPSD